MPTRLEVIEITFLKFDPVYAKELTDFEKYKLYPGETLELKACQENPGKHHEIILKNEKDLSKLKYYKENSEKNDEIILKHREKEWYVFSDHVKVIKYK